MSKPSIEERLYRALGRYDGVIYTRPPGDQLYMEQSNDLVVKTNNDGFELWIGSSDEWYWHCKSPKARELAWFILWTWWFKGTWCGIRTWAWYKLLSRKVQRYKVEKR